MGHFLDYWVSEYWADQNKGLWPVIRGPTMRVWLKMKSNKIWMYWLWWSSDFFSGIMLSFTFGVQSEMSYQLSDGLPEGGLLSYLHLFCCCVTSWTMKSNHNDRSRKFWSDWEDFQALSLYVERAGNNVFFFFFLNAYERLYGCSEACVKLDYTCSDIRSTQVDNWLLHSAVGPFDLMLRGHVMKEMFTGAEPCRDQTLALATLRYGFPCVISIVR